MKHLVTFEKVFPKNILAFTADRAADFHFERSTPQLKPNQKIFLKKYAGLEAEAIFNIQQIHGCRVVLGKPHQEKILKADASTTNMPGVALAVRTADCLPIFLYDPKHKAIGMVHAGWKSTYKKIVVHTLKAMKRKYQTQYKDVKVAFGPAMHACCFEVDKAFLGRFPKDIFSKRGKFYFDNAAANKRQLVSMGVLPRNIYDKKVCTYCNNQFFSYRRDGKDTGRILSVIMLKT